MKSSTTRILAYLEGANKRFVAPVYKRKYSWNEENCAQLYEDLKKVVQNNESSHFFGSFVSSVVSNGAIIEYHIIDGQQRLTTVALLLLAIRNMIQEGKIQSRKKALAEEIERFLVSKWAEEKDRIKLHLVDSDSMALMKLFSTDDQNYDHFSQMTLNYLYFCRELQKGEVSADELFDAVGKLEIISITLEQEDNAQLILESLNSTGQTLEDGDKICNYVLMRFSPKKQKKYYDRYWKKIERCTWDDVGGFVRDYLSIKQRKTPAVNRVYPAFKSYAQEEENAGQSMEKLLEDMLRYARLYEKLLTCRCGLKNQQLDDCLYRMKRLEFVDTRPFLMEVLCLNQDGQISTDDVLRVFLITENYLFRRIICEVPDGVLTKIFVNLNWEILCYDNTSDNYVDKLIFTLRSKKGSWRFPDDKEFGQALSNKQIYCMNGKYKAYIFERFENYGTLVINDVYMHLDNYDYSIEHIMPQHLTSEWKKELGPDAEEIHETWQHRLANLTLTRYNPDLSNKSFQEKRDAEEGGYRTSGLRINKNISMKESWGLPELEERNEEMISRAKEIWKLPQTGYQPPVKEYESYTLYDEDVDLTGRDIVKYSYQNREQSVESWAEMFSSVVEYLHHKDHSVLSKLAYGRENGAVSDNYVSATESDLHSAMKVDEQIYVEAGTTTLQKLSILRRLFELYDADPMDLVYYLRKENISGQDDPEMRKRYWTYALPNIRKENKNTGNAFKDAFPTSNESIYTSAGVGGYLLGCTAGLNEIEVSFRLHNRISSRNQEGFNLLYAHRQEIEDALQVPLTWKEPEKEHHSYKVIYSLEGASYTNENDWQRMSEFHAEWSNKLYQTLMPYLKEKDAGIQNEIAGMIQEWADEYSDIHVDPACSNSEVIRFTTDAMNEVLPYVEDAKSIWHNGNYYFYEIWNSTLTSLNIKFVLSTWRVPDELKEKIEFITGVYPDKRRKKGGKQPICFQSKSFTFGDDLSKETMFAGLDRCMKEVRKFEADLKEKIQG